MTGRGARVEEDVQEGLPADPGPGELLGGGPDRWPPARAASPVPGG